MKTILSYTKFTLCALVISGICSSCEEDEFQSGIRISDLSQAFASNGDINRAAYARVNADGSLTAALSAESLTGFLPTEQAYKDAGYINAESVNEGDAAVLKDILLYHVAPDALRSDELSSGALATLASGKSINVGFLNEYVVLSGIGNQGMTSRIIATDASVANGFIHVTERLLLPNPRKVTDIATQNGYFDLLEAAWVRAGLMNTFAGTGPFTVFAPGDMAFIHYLEIPTKDVNGNDRPYAAVQAEALAAINAADPAALAELLNYHVVDGLLESDDFEASALATRDGRSITIDVDDNGNLKGVYGIGNVDNEGEEILTNPLQVNVRGINGVIHIVDSVLKPEL